MTAKWKNFHFPEGSVWECPKCHAFNFTGRSCRCGYSMPVNNRVEAKTPSKRAEGGKKQYSPKSVSETGILESFHYRKGEKKQ